MHNRLLFCRNRFFAPWKMLCLLGIISTLISCRKENSEKKYRIGVSQCTTGDSWRKDMREGMERELSFYPEMSMTEKDAKGNTQKQIQQIQEFIDEKFDLLIVSPNESKSFTPIIEKAYSSGIPVVLVDRRTTSDKFTAFVGADNYRVGLYAGMYANILLKGKGNILEVGWGINSSPSIGRHTGFLSAIKKHEGLHYMASLWSSVDSVKTYLQTHPSVNLVFAHNDRLAYDVYRICEELGLNQKIKIIGVDGLAGKNEGLDLVRSGKISATILYPTGGEEAILTAAKILKHETFKKENELFTTVIDPQNVSIMFSQLQKVKEQQRDIERQSSKIAELIQTFSSQRNILYFTTVLLTILIISGAFLYYLVQEKQQSNKVLEEQNKAILEQKNEIEKISLLAKQATEEKLRFYSYISHEFRTPLSLILTPTEDLLQRKTNDVKETRNTLHLIFKNANRLLRLVDQLLELRKLDAGKMQLEAKQHDLVSFVKDIVADFNVKAKSQQVDLQFICPFSALPFWFDAEKLDKVLFNIISNAFKYTMQGGAIHVTLLKNVEKIEIMIADNGIGMNEVEKAHAFDLFYRGNQNISLGTGLGLALSMEFVNLHQGKIELDSEKGKGTSFKITLPFIQAENQQLSKPEVVPYKSNILSVEPETSVLQQEESKPRENTIVLIEDNPDLNAFLKQKLEANYHIASVESAEKGWEEILLHIPDLILSDVMLPGMDGFSLTQRIKQDFRTSHIPVILLTAKGQLENQIEGTKVGADAYIPKPFNLEFLEEKIKGLLGNRDRMRRRFSSEVTNPSNIVKGERRFLVEFELLIEKNIKDSSLSVEKLSQELGMSRVQLFRKVSALTNKNVTDYIADFKLLKAKALLKDSEKTIAEIAYETGFNNPSYFTTFFKQKTNQTPTEYRNG
ncbi:ABC-type sugar transport system, substrate-binding protein, contains N-terminal xre family HTH domain [Pseudarcicella hirudinis]|uniref:histidine kinase n=2 Tax=Pseudarcicella hirudinis TaxID=1079859 RepID=A0A1I5RGN6_9BACT|nr:ABC-type sugar transport system, substrate-binding protein, contains N-terminal xre family HTH domain [Pseudarcicella hirudinis]